MEEFLIFATAEQEVQFSKTDNQGCTVTVRDYNNGGIVSVGISLETARKRGDEYWNELAEYLMKYFKDMHGYDLTVKDSPFAEE